MCSPQVGFACRSSYVEMPSLIQRGILFLVLVSVTVWQNSCQMTASQLVGCAKRDAGLFTVTTRPKHTPRKPSAPGKPNVRISKSCCNAKTSTVVGSDSVTPY